MTTELWYTVFAITSLVMIASMWWLGFWSNFVTMVNVFLAGAIATSFYQNLANAMVLKDDSWIFLVDFVVIWLLFVLSFIALRTITEQLSRLRLRFYPVVEHVGRVITTLGSVGIFTMFASFTLFLAPIPPSQFASFPMGIGQLAETWGGAVDMMSRNSLAADPDKTWFGNSNPTGSAGGRPFISARHHLEWGTRLRNELEQQTTLRRAREER